MKDTNTINIFGPIILESLDQMTPVAALLKRHQQNYLNTQLFSDNHEPKSFKGLGESGTEILEILRILYREDEIKFVCGAYNIEQLRVVLPWASVVQVNLQTLHSLDFSALLVSSAVAEGKLILLNRHATNTLEEWFKGAQVLQSQGMSPEKILLCEFSKNSQTLLKAVKEAGFRVIVKSQAPLQDEGLFCECHPFPEESLSFPQEEVSLEQLEILLN